MFQGSRTNRHRRLYVGRQTAGFSTRPLRRTLETTDMFYARQSSISFLCARQLGNKQRLTGLEIAFAAEPVFHRDVHVFDRHAIPSLELAVAHREHVVEDGIVGEVENGEIDNPKDRA